MKKAKKTPVFFIATKIKENPVSISFYTTKGKKVRKELVQKEKSSKRGFYYFATL